MFIAYEPGEVFWGMRASDGKFMPFSDSVSGTYHISLHTNDSDTSSASGQVNPLLISSHGRWFWLDREFDAEFTSDGITLKNMTVPPVSGREPDLKSAFLTLASRFFPAQGKLCDLMLLERPQYNTWVELQVHQNQEGTLRYAHGIIDNGFPAGVIMLDDTWQENFGVFNFHPGRFSDPAAMCRELHELGFKVMVWVTPFISPDSMPFRKLFERGLIVTTADGNPYIRRWWNGYSAILDLSNPEAIDWLRGELHRLMDDYGVDGFKFDAGHPAQFGFDGTGITSRPITAQEYNSLYVDLASEFDFNECKSCWKHAGWGLAERQGDKRHSWDSRGLAALIPNSIAQGLLGFACNCPDMIGGGSVAATGSDLSYDEELFIRTAQCSALFPMMQFSAAPWRVLSPEGVRLCREAAELHVKFAPVITELAREYAQTGAPILRPMEYEFPHAGFERIVDQFMLGSDTLVAPVLEKGARTRNVLLPEGEWVYADGSVYAGGQTVTVPAPLDILPYFVKRG